MWSVVFLMLYLLFLSVYDVREKQVPIVLLVAGAIVAVIGLLCGVLMGDTNWLRLLGALPGVFLLLMTAITQKVGCGDGIVLIIVGVMLGFGETALLLCMSLLLFSFVSIPLLALRKVRGHTQLPYLPFLTMAFILQKFLITGIWVK